jgi:16S rRNA (cytosine967-C5)-methyltransferase
VGPSGAVDAADQHPQKLARLDTELERMKLAPRASYSVDWTVGSGQVPFDYDRVLVDAPCSGIGTLRRRPDLATRREESSLAELAALQAQVLTRAAAHVKVGGFVLYAVCSVLREECEEVIEAVTRAEPWLRPTPFPEGPARILAGEKSTLRLTPYEHGTDGYFLAMLRREA